VGIDGRWWLIALLVARLDRDLPTICEAVGRLTSSANRAMRAWPPV